VFGGILPKQTTINPTRRNMANHLRTLPTGAMLPLYQVNTALLVKKAILKVLPPVRFNKSTGFNVIYVMPITRRCIEATNSPYATKDYNEVGSEFGTLDDFRAWWSGAHKRKIAVMLDIVANHTSWTIHGIAINRVRTGHSRNIKYPEIGKMWPS